MEWAIDEADVVEWATRYTGEPFHAMLCDPPYELKFMGRKWDASGVAFNPETWAALATHLHPGAFGMAFASSRGWHRLAVAIEDAGLIIHPSIFGWSAGAGFPKATRVPDERFDEHRYGLQAMKPALEPLVLFSKPSCDDEAQAIIYDTSLLLEELWTQFATTADDIMTAEQIVRSALDNAAAIIGKAETHIFVKGAASNLNAQGPCQKGEEPIARKPAKKRRRGNGSIAQTAGNPSTSGHPPSKHTQEASCTVADNVIKSTESSSQSASASNAANPFSPRDRERKESSAPTIAPMSPDNDRSLKTPLETETDTDIRAAMLRFNSERAVFDLSTIWLWKITWDDACYQASKSTTGMASKTIIALRILNSSLRRLTLNSRDMASLRNSSEHLWRYALDVNGKLGEFLACPMASSFIAARAALEPIILFQKPYANRPVESIVATGAGALWIDGARIGTDTIAAHEGSTQKDAGVFGGGEGLPPVERGLNERQGRWPANLALIHSPECSGTCVPGCPVRELDLQAGFLPAFGSVSASENSNPGYSGNMASKGWEGYGDAGGPSRFFFNADWMLERLEQTNPVFYAGKATTAERDAGLDSPVANDNSGRIKPVDNPYLRGETLRRNTHPTIKPLSLARWLATLLLPPAEYAPRRLLVPFSGAGSEMIGAGMAGWEFCQGVELNKSDDGSDYIAIAEARLRHWLEGPTITVEVNQSGEVVTMEQMRLL